tara:strand:+ start:43 stop:576 length:534 start_codon:yes stop_codon:yes gene_type:complete
LRSKKFVLLFLAICFCKSAIAEKIVVVNIQFLIDNNIFYNDKIKEMEISQQEYLQKFKNTENNLQNMLSEIEESKLLLNENEINSRINKYNIELSDFKILVEDFNFHFQNQVINIRESILKEIILILENYAIKNNIDLILDSTSYLIASNTIDITNNIKLELDKIDLKLEYKDFEKN